MAFLHAESTYQPEEIEIQRALARRLIKSAKRFGYQVVQLTDRLTPNIGADEVEVYDIRGKTWMEYVLGVIASQPPETLYIDTDCVIQKDVSWIFRDDFDVCLCFRKRNFPQYTDTSGRLHHMPITGGVVFCRNPDYWNEVKDEVGKMDDPMMKAWWGGQAAMYKVYQRAKYRVQLIEADRFNYTPNSPDEDLSDKDVVHYKGQHRKHWNLEGSWKPMPREKMIPIGVL